MPPPEHPSEQKETHFRGNSTVRDIIIGMADGLTVPFALAAGISGAVHSTGIIVIAGLAEIAAGSISMGLGGYLAGRSDVEHYRRERRIEERAIREVPSEEEDEVNDVLRGYGLPEEDSRRIVALLCPHPEAWVDFMLRFELGLEPPHPHRALISGVTIGGAYIVGGIIPLAPYMLVSSVRTAFIISACVTLSALAIFGAIRGRFTGVSPLRSAWQTLLIGGIAAAAAFLLARAIS